MALGVGTKSLSIKPGSPSENGYCEAFNGKLRSGVAWQRIEIASFCSPDGATTSFCFFPENESHLAIKMGWTVGGGIKYRLKERWTARVEYWYVDFGAIDQQCFRALPRVLMIGLRHM